jgi:hypothetical protein
MVNGLGGSATCRRTLVPPAFAGAALYSLHYFDAVEAAAVGWDAGLGEVVGEGLRGGGADR